METKKSTTYKTRQRKAILDFIKDNKQGMFTVRDIYDSFLNTKNSIGMATIYRHLEALTKNDMLLKNNIEGISGACYKFKCPEASSEHARLMCEGCGNLSDLDCNFISNINSHLLAKHRFNVNPDKMVFYGKCNECMKKR